MKDGLSTKASKNIKFRRNNLDAFSGFVCQKMPTITEAETKQKKKKTTWIFLIINIAIVAAIFIYQFGFKETKPLSELFAEKPFYRYFFISLGVIAACYVFIALQYSMLLKTTTGKFRFWLGLQFALVGKYWDNITPFGTGGQFAQVAHGIKKGVNQEDTTSIIVSKYMINMLAFVALGIAALFVPIDTFTTSTTATIVKILAGVGVGINILLTIFIWIVSVNKKLCSIIVVGGLKLLHKMHIVKNYNVSLIKSLRFIKQYQKSFKYLIKKPWLIIGEFLLSVMELISLAMIAFLVYLAFNPNGGVSVITILSMSFLCSFATSYIPIPGGSGMAEISFAGLFSTLFTEGTVFWALIIWRIFTYYLLIIFGFGFTITDSIIHSRKLKRTNRKK